MRPGPRASRPTPACHPHLPTRLPARPPTAPSPSVCPLPRAQEAQTAREQTNGYKLDKNHTFVVNMFDDLDKYAKVHLKTFDVEGV